MSKAPRLSRAQQAAREAVSVATLAGGGTLVGSQPGIAVCYLWFVISVRKCCALLWPSMYISRLFSGKLGPRLSCFSCKALSHVVPGTSFTLSVCMGASGGEKPLFRGDSSSAASEWGGLAAVPHPSGEPRMGLLTRRGQILSILIRFVAKQWWEGLGR